MSIPDDYDWVSLLAERFASATHASRHTSAGLHEHTSSLQIAKAAIDKIRLDEEYPSRARHIAVLGPTQSGKSTLVNLLLDTTAASVSALAGFTVHTQGYARRIDDVDATFVQHMMTPLQIAAADTLESNHLDSYVLESVRTGEGAMVGDAIIWDTPDFDSISASTYHLAVLKTAALADVVVLTISKDKYGDKRVWDMLGLLQGLGKPLLICINKIDEHDRAVVRNAFTERFTTLFSLPVPPMVMLPFVTDEYRADVLSKQAHTLHTTLRTVLDTVDRGALATHCAQFVATHEAAWLQPVMIELHALNEWQQLVDSAVDKADVYYQTNYLDSPDKYETFNRALAELLTLLEIPGVAPTLAHARKIITWPARQLLGAGRRVVERGTGVRRDKSAAPPDQEAIVLEHILDSTLAQLQGALLNVPVEPWWQALMKTLRTEKADIRIRYHTASERARHLFEPEIDKAAQQLYDQLKKQPALLNTLRAARVSADAAGIALAVKSGGLAPTDLILAPAMLSVTTLLTESALGRYLDSVKRELKQRQRRHIRGLVFEQALKTSLDDLARQLHDSSLLSNNMEPVLKAHLDAYMTSQNH